MVETASETGEQSPQVLVERKESALVNHLSLGLGAIITIIAVTWAIDFWLDLGFTWYDEQAMIACLGLTLGIVFIRFPLRGGTERPSVPWYDIILAALGVGVAFYFVYIYDDIANNPFAMRPKAFVIGLIIIPLVWETLRRTAGWSLTLVFTVFVAYAFVGHLMPGMLQGIEQKNVDVIAFLGTSEVALIGLPLKIIVLTVVLFIWMGQLLLHTGASEWFTELAAALMGRSRGGSAKIAVVASGLFGSISGSAVSNVASTGVITIPLMRQAGYDAKSAGAIEAVASTGGQIMPPIMGAAAFLMAELSGAASYTEVILAALVPSLLYYVVGLRAGRPRGGEATIFAPMAPEEIESRRSCKVLAGRLVVHWSRSSVLIVARFSGFNMNADRRPPCGPRSPWPPSASSVGYKGYKGNRLMPRQFVVEALTGSGEACPPASSSSARCRGMIIGLDRASLDSVSGLDPDPRSSKSDEDKPAGCCSS